MSYRHETKWCAHRVVEKSITWIGCVYKDDEHFGTEFTRLGLDFGPIFLLLEIKILKRGCLPHQDVNDEIVVEGWCVRPVCISGGSLKI